MASSQASSSNSQESFAFWDRDSSSLRTAQLSLFEDWIEYSERLPNSGSMRNGELYRHENSALRTFESESGLLPTPTATPYGSNQGGSQGREGKERLSLDQMARSGKWIPTPTASDAKGSRNCTHNYPEGSTAKPGVTLTDFVTMYPTPASRDYRYPNKKSYAERGGGKKGEQLPNVVGGPLNPAFVEWLLGYPIGHTDLEHSAIQ